MRAHLTEIARQHTRGLINGAELYSETMMILSREKLDPDHFTYLMRLYNVPMVVRLHWSGDVLRIKLEEQAATMTGAGEGI